MDTHHGMHMFVNRGSPIIVGAQILLAGLLYPGSQLLITLHPSPHTHTHAAVETFQFFLVFCCSAISFYRVTASLLALQRFFLLFVVLNHVADQVTKKVIQIFEGGR